MCMALVMLYLTVVLILPTDFNAPFNEGEIIFLSSIYIPLACCFFNIIFKEYTYLKN